MTTTPEKPVRATRGRSPGQPASMPPPEPPQPMRGKPKVPRGKSRKNRGLEPDEVAGAVSATSARDQTQADAPPRDDTDAEAERKALERQRVAYPWHTPSHINHDPDERLLAPIRTPLEAIGNRLGVRPYQFFWDWLIIVDLSLKHLPGHVANARKTGQSVPFPPGTPQEEIDEWNAVWPRYGSNDNQQFVYDKFREAFHALLDAAADGIFDYVGHLYMNMQLGDSKYKAQYFTPMSVASLMAQMTQPAANVYEHIYQALTHPDNAAGQALLFASMVFSLQPREGNEAEDAPVVEAIAGGAEEFFFQKLLPAALPYYEVVEVNDCAVGSGVMLLAAAGCVPVWMNDLGLIRYSGMDVDAFCVRMASINLRLFGLNGYAMECWIAAQDEDTLAAINNPVKLAELEQIRTQLKAAREAARLVAEEAEKARIEEVRAARQAGSDDVKVEFEESTTGKKKVVKAGGTAQLELF
ncbi:hypothetical protein K2Z83_20355 [Oscillochloris sp. ZM17-4]|uniref:hypothetical protein n=1 Tax=Oscillochloris sp. ZM17-4 TaxID=2866714 RepID=UPI001C73C305|nr:hypothetical protein [Oscillochloris sp. ZM17-4]MBX0330024.1 hypothetical protein [Oscillochloris sp. ZM17-4]